MARIKITPSGDSIHSLLCSDCPNLQQVSRDLSQIERNARVHAGKFPGHIVYVTTTTQRAYTAAQD